MPGQVGEEHMALLQSLKKHFDPENIMNPGGTLALDMSAAQADKCWGIE
jgi:alkyldihydroxyacetonephosphate synthase